MTVYYSCDSHVVEAPEVYDGLVDRFGDRAPRVVNGLNGREGVFLYWPQHNRPITMHIFCGATWNMAQPEYWDPIVSYTLSHAVIWNTVSNIVTSGVPERHPNLKFICAEWETGWVAHTLRRWDHAAYRTPEVAS